MSGEPQVMDLDEALNREEDRAMRNWTRVAFRMAKWIEFTEKKIVAVLKLQESHPRRRKEGERADAERKSMRCRHPLAQLQRGGNASAKWESCGACGIRLSYESNKHRQRQPMAGDQARKVTQETYIASQPQKAKDRSSSSQQAMKGGHIDQVEAAAREVRKKDTTGRASSKRREEPKESPSEITDQLKRMEQHFTEIMKSQAAMVQTQAMQQEQIRQLAAMQMPAAPSGYPPTPQQP